MLEQDDDVPPLDPLKVAVFVLMLGLIAFAGWRYWRARAVVAAAAAATKDDRKLFAARSAAMQVPPPKAIVTTGAPVSGMGLLKIDDDMRAPKPVFKSAPAAESAAVPPPETPPVAAVMVQAAAPVKPAEKTFKQPRLNSGAFSGLNGGAGIRPKADKK